MGAHRLVVWGSCITRDVIDLLPPGYRLVKYIARQSWLSIGSDASALVGPLDVFNSAFQARMVADDLEGNALSELESLNDQIDHLLIDLCDERHGVVRLNDGSILTRSVEKISAGIQPTLDAQGTVLAFGGLEHLWRWSESAESIISQLKQIGLAERTLVVAPDWALTDQDGHPTASSYGLVPATANEWFARYYDVLSGLGVTVMRFSGTVAATDHQWGPAAFHYDDATSHRIATALHTAMLG